MASLIACSLTLSKSRSEVVTKIEQLAGSDMELKTYDSRLGMICSIRVVAVLVDILKGKSKVYSRKF